MALFPRTRRWSSLLLAAYLILVGVFAFVNPTFISTGPILAVLALAAGILILLDR
jgi:hypothetical protein